MLGNFVSMYRPTDHDIYKFACEGSISGYLQDGNFLLCEHKE
jgi:hypothetical protein